MERISRTSKMRINVTRRSRRLETISGGDVLVFKNREEKVSGVDVLSNLLYAERTVQNKDWDSATFPVKKESVLYKGEKIYSASKGEVVDWIKGKSRESLQNYNHGMAGAI